MNDMDSLCLFAMNQKGLAVVEAVCMRPNPSIACVVAARDANVRHDFYGEIQAASLKRGIPFLDRADAKDLSVEYAIAVGWRWMIRGCRRLIVFHDSLLPRYRGFAPLPTALINGDEEVGVTALFGADEYDSGNIIAQRKLPIQYPVKIQEVVNRIAGLYAELAVELIGAILSGSPLASYPQDEGAASYSAWRDEDDYRIDWSLDAAAIKRLIDAVGYPYHGASADLNGTPARILDAAVDADVKIEQRFPGKVMFVRDGLPIVSCGTGMLWLLDVRNDAGTESLLPLPKFRTRFR
jgi:methionyl-tRNA formyltransferase